MDKTILMTYLRQLEVRMVQPVAEIGSWAWRSASHDGPGQYEYDQDWQPVSGRELFPRGKTIFLRTVYHCPDHLLLEGDQQDYLFCRVAYLEGYLRVNGAVYHGLDRNRDRIPLNPAWPGTTLELEMELFTHNTYTSETEQPWFSHARIGRIDKRIEAFYYDLKLAVDTYYLDETLVSRFSRNLEAAQRALNHAPAGFVKPRLMQAIDSALKDFDLSLQGEAFLNSMVRAGQILNDQLAAIDDGSIKGLVSLVGHTHVDVAWLWQLKDTVRKCGHSFANMLRIMEEYPEFSFSCSQPQLYAYTKDYYPELYEQLKQQVAAGRWELVGPMWVESDCNVISGESLVRQLLHGHQFLLDEFGHTSDICWLPDTFGFQPNMPQILKKSGVNSFFSYKLHWQTHNRFPYGSFRWRGIDGSEVIASVPELVSGYNGNPDPSQLRYAQDANLQKETVADVIFPYGWGDGGGGPTRDMVEYARRLRRYPSLPDSRMTTAHQYFSDLHERAADLPVWYGELALETHRGTFTTQGAVKRANRQCEILLQTAEKLAVTSGLAEDAAIRVRLQQAWQTVLLLQFHDILPGSSIHEVYADALPMYASVMQDGRQMIEAALDRLGGPADEQGTDLLVYNPLSWTRSEAVQVWLACATDETVRLVNDQGEAVVSVEQAREPGRVCLSFAAAATPALGYALYRIERRKAGTESVAVGAVVCRTSDGLQLESGRYRMDIRRNGQMTRLYDKAADREVIRSVGNDLELFHDGPQGEDAWNLYADYRKRPYRPDWQDELILAENSPLRTVLVLKKRTDRSELVEQVILDHVSGRIDFDLQIDWQEQHKLLKVGFDLNVQAPYALCDTGFGSFMRPVVANNPYDKEKFEVIAHKWVDLSEGDYGAAVLNDSKYGHSIVDSRIEISLLRSTIAPDEKADRGRHQIRYSLYPHQGDWRQARTAQQGFAFNTPMICRVLSVSGQQKTAGRPYFSLDQAGLVLDTVKPAWDGRGVIVRIHETTGNRGRAILRAAGGMRTAEETNLVEREAQPLAIQDNNIVFAYRPYEIKTFRLELM